MVRKSKRSAKARGPRQSASRSRRAKTITVKAPQGMELITEVKLKEVLLGVIKSAEFNWVQSVEIERYPLQIPNWRILRIISNAATTDAPMLIVNHPAVKKLQNQYFISDDYK